MVTHQPLPGVIQQQPHSQSGLGIGATIFASILTACFILSGCWCSLPCTIAGIIYGIRVSYIHALLLLKFIVKRFFFIVFFLYSLPWLILFAIYKTYFHHYNALSLSSTYIHTYQAISSGSKGYTESANHFGKRSIVSTSVGLIFGVAITIGIIVYSYTNPSRTAN